MVRVSDAATVTARALGTKDDESVESRAYLVWQRAQRNITATESTPDGIVYHGNLTSVILNLWPELSAADRHNDLERFRSEIYAYLRVTKNAVCTKRSARGSQVEWLLSAQWNIPTGAVVLSVPVRAPLKLTHTEKKLTPHEAGEDRVPAPVTVRFVAPPTPGAEDDVQSPIPAVQPVKEDEVTATLEAPAQTGNAATQQAERHREILELIKMSLAEQKEPMTYDELAADVGISPSTARQAITELVAAGTAFSRTETKAERAIRFGGDVSSKRSTLLSSQNPVPARKSRQLIAGVVASAAPRTPAPKFSRDAAVLRTMRSDRWERGRAIITRAKVPSGSSTMVFQRLIEQGHIEMKTKKVGNDPNVRFYRKIAVAKVTPEPVSTPQADIAPAPQSTTVNGKSVKTRAVEAVETLLSEVLGGDLVVENSKLRAENETLKARVAELEAVLRPLQNVLGGK